MKIDNQTKSSKVESQLLELPKAVVGSEKVLGTANGVTAQLAGNAFSMFYTLRGNGTHRAVRFDHPSINANSRVFVSISEFNSDAAINRFIGFARMTICNVAPFNGGFLAWLEISWNNPINARVDILVEP